MTYLKSPLVFERTQSGCLYLSREVLKVIRPFVQNIPEKLEAGGLLMGRYLLSGEGVIVDAVTTPGPGDTRFRTSFFRSQRWHQAKLLQAWQETAQTCTYLGEWHTHPQAIPEPSRQDRATWQRKLVHDQYGESLFFLVVGSAEARIWEGESALHLRELSLKE
jgi:integrative and conjugative element protein (TIGR02256 family)